MRIEVYIGLQGLYRGHVQIYDIGILYLGTGLFIEIMETQKKKKTENEMETAI